MTALEAAYPELMALPLFSGYGQKQVGLFCQNGQVLVSNHRDEIFCEGRDAQCFGIVLSGAYKISRVSPMGEDVIVHFSTPGEVVAAFIMSQPKPKYPVSVKAMGPSRLLKIPRENYMNYWAKESELIFRIQNLLSTRMALLHDQKVMSRSPLSSKLALLLIMLLEKQKTNERHMLPLPLTRQELADNLGASVESVIRIMSEWSKAGYISTEEHQIYILQPNKIIEKIKPNTNEE